MGTRGIVWGRFKLRLVLVAGIAATLATLEAQVVNPVESLAPSVATLSASGIFGMQATLRGAANPGNSSTSGWFEWGTPPGYATATAPQPLGNGSASTNYSATIAGLVPNMYYHFRAVASNTFGITVGSNRLFVTVPPLYWEDFDTDHTANWIVNSWMPGNNAADFFFDYSSVGIPPAPNSISTTRGLKLEANYANNFFTGLSVSPAGQIFMGDYVLTFDIWWNYISGFGASGSTQITGAGVATAGNSPQWSGGMHDSVFFGVTGDGGSAEDYRAYSSMVAMLPYQTPSGLYFPPSGVYVAGAFNGAINNTNDYYASFGGNQVPAAQTVIDPFQTGVSAPGAPGFRWFQGKIVKTNTTITFSLNDLPIATVNASSVILGGGNILFNHYDVNSSSSTDPNRRLFQFGLIDNVMVTRSDPPAPVLSGASRLPDGTILLNGLGMPHTTYNMQATSQLLLDGVWMGSTIGAPVADADGVILFVDPIPATNQSRFYRLRRP